MDPLLLEALRFGVAILAGGIVAVISSILAFRYARRLQLEDAERRDASLRRALVAEIRENMARLGGPDRSRMPGVRTVRAAWDAARGLLLSAAAFDAIARAYASAEEVSWSVELVAQRAVNTRMVVNRSEELRGYEDNVRRLRHDARAAYVAFASALDALGEHSPDEPAVPAEADS